MQHGSGSGDDAHSGAGRQHQCDRQHRRRRDAPAPGTNNGVLVRNQSTINNAGSILVTGNTFDGFSLQGSGNAATNTGLIHTTGNQSEAMFTTGSGNTMVNGVGGVVQIDGGSHGLLSFGAATTLSPMPA